MALAQPPLTAREAQVAELAVRGFASKEIANLLVLSPHTIHSHLRNIFRKCEVISRAQLIAWWWSREQPGAAIADGFVRGSERTGPKVLEKLSRPGLVGAAIVLIVVAMLGLSLASNSHRTVEPSVVAIAEVTRTFSTSGGLDHSNGATVVCEQAGGAEGIVYFCPPPPTVR